MSTNSRKRPVQKPAGKTASKQAPKRKNPYPALIGAVVVLAAAVFIIVKAAGGSGVGGAPIQSSGNLLIPKSAVTEKVTFYPYKVGNVKMEVLALKAPDGTIRTAFNTCQVCYDSGKGYYIQEGDELVCQNCLNRFKSSDVEVVHGGCNPVPILSQDKTDDGTNITISQAFLEKNKDLFLKWKK